MATEAEKLRKLTAGLTFHRGEWRGTDAFPIEPPKPKPKVERIDWAELIEAIATVVVVYGVIIGAIWGLLHIILKLMGVS